MREPSKALIEKAKSEAKRLNHIVLIGLPVFADKRSAPALFDAGNRRMAWDKWKQEINLCCAVLPDGTILE